MAAVPVLGIACSARSTGASASDAGTSALPSAVEPTESVASADEVELGRLLFWDPILSGARDVACASCHHPDFAYTDGKSIAIGTGSQHAARNALTILDTAWNGVTLGAPIPDAADAPMFWDNRVRSLETQAKGPLTALAEMRGPAFDETTIFPELVIRLGSIAEYQSRFTTAFGETGITEDTIVAAISAFERTLVDAGSSYDRFTHGETAALSAAQQHGLTVLTQSGCTGCHSGPMFSDYTLHALGGLAGTGSFRTPSLRNVTRTAPYLQDGSRATLDAMFDVYRTIDRNADPKLRNVRSPQGTDRADAIAFLGALSDGDFDRTVPTAVPSGLRVGGVHP